MMKSPEQNKEGNVGNKGSFKSWRERLAAHLAEKEEETRTLRRAMEDYLNYRNTHDCLMCTSGPHGCIRCTPGVKVRQAHEEFLKKGNSEEDWIKIWNSTRERDTLQASDK